LYGNPNTNGRAIYCWPSEAELREKSKETLSKLRFQKVEYGT